MEHEWQQESNLLHDRRGKALPAQQTGAALNGSKSNIKKGAAIAERVRRFIYEE